MIADKIIKANQAMTPRPLKSLAFKEHGSY